MTGLVDCAMHRHSHNVNRSLLHGDQDVTIDEDLITCGHHSNTYSVSSASQTTIANHAGRELTSKPSGKRIDFILFKLAQTCSCEQECSCNIKHSCHGLRDVCPGKDPITGLSFSDHQPVTIKLVIKKEKNRSVAATPSFADSSDGAVPSRRRIPSVTSDHPDDECLTRERALKTITSSLNFKNGSIIPSPVDQSDMMKFDRVKGILNPNYNGGIGTKQRSHSIGPVLTEDSSTAIGDFEKEDQLMIEKHEGNGNRDDHRNVLLDILPGRRANSLANHTTTTTTVLSSAKVHFNPDSAVIPLDEPSLKHLQSMYQLLLDYMNQNSISKRRFYLLVFATSLLLMAVVTVVSSTLNLSSSVIFHTWFGIICLSGIVVFLTEFANRMERTAIKSILEEVSSILSFAPNHLSANLS